MESWFNIVLNLSVAGSGVFVLSYLITYLFRNIISGSWHFWNRKLALLFFLFPIYSLYGIFNNYNDGGGFVAIQSSSILNEHKLMLSSTFIKSIFVIWLIGFIFTTIWFVYKYLYFKNILKRNLTSIPVEKSVRLLLANNLSEMRIKKSIEIVYCQLNVSPMLIGTFKPMIVLPIVSIPHDELDLIIKHELTHYKNKDLWVKKIMIIATMVHWYNPLIYLLKKEINKWCELTCDEYIVMNMSYQERKKYGETILNTMSRSNQDVNSSLHGAPLSRESINLKNRLINILDNNKKSKYISLMSAVLLTSIGSLGIVSSALTLENMPDISNKVNDYNDDISTYDPFDVESAEEVEHVQEVLTVKKSEQKRFSTEDWERILKLVEENKVILVDD